MAKQVYVVGINRGGEYWFNLSPSGNFGYETKEAAEQLAERCRQTWLKDHPGEEELAKEYYKAMPITIERD